MAGLPWLKLDVNLPHDPRVAALARALACDRATALGTLSALLCWTARYFPLGSIPASDLGAVADGCLWRGEPTALIDALIEAGFLARAGRRLIVAQWRAEHAAHANRMERDRERMRAKRAAERGSRRGTVAGPSNDRRGERRGDQRRGRRRSCVAFGAAARRGQAVTGPPRG